MKTTDRRNEVEHQPNKRRTMGRELFLSDGLSRGRGDLSPRLLSTSLVTGDRKQQLVNAGQRVLVRGIDRKRAGPGNEGLSSVLGSRAIDP